MPSANPPYQRPAARRPADEIRSLAVQVGEEGVVRLLLESLPLPAVVLTRERQVVAANEKALLALGAEDLSGLAGARPGEILGCVEAARGEDGCGTGPGCVVCGAGRALSDVEGGVEGSVIRECRIVTGGESLGALDLEAQVTSIRAGDRELLLLSLKDVSGEKRRRVLERTFFHDVLNTAGGVKGLSDALGTVKEIDAADREEIVELLRISVTRLVDEIVHQRRLLAAETGEYAADWRTTDLGALLTRVRDTYVHHEVAKGRTIVVEAPAAAAEIETDPVLLERSTANLVKNALEATPKGGSVHMTAGIVGDRAEIEVTNPGVIPEPVRLEIFKRSFSTKATSGRGIGTWSVKLFVEAVLGGQADFTCDPAAGTTTFRIRVPVERAGSEPDSARIWT